MIIRSVELVNFLSHRHTKVDFDAGIVAIVGPNGAGKSSIIDAISFALFNTHSRGSRSNKPLVRLGAHTAMIRVEFEVGGKRYAVEKRIDSSGRTLLAKLEEISGDGKRRVLARDVRTVTGEVGRLLGVKPDTARIAMISQQGELAEILESSRRREYVNRMLGLDAIEKAYEKLRPLLQSYRLHAEHALRLVKEKEARLASIREELGKLRGVEEELEKTRAEAERVSEELRKVGAELESLLAEKASLEAKLRSLEESAERLEAKQARLEELLEELEQVERELKELEKYNLPEEKYRLLSQAQQLIAELRMRAQRYREIENELHKIEELEDELRNMEEALRELGEVEKLAEEARRLKAEYDSIRSELEQARKRREALRSEIERLHSEIIHYASKLLKVKAELLERESLEDIQARVKSLEDSLRSELEKLREMHRQLQAKQGGLESRFNDLGDIISKLAAAHGRCPVCNRPLSEQERLRLIRRFREERERLKQELNSIRAKLRELEARLRRFERELNEISNLKAKLAGLTERYRRALEELEYLERKMRELEGRLRSLSVRHVQLSNVEEELRRLEELRRRYYELRGLIANRERLMVEKERLEEEIASLGTRLEEIAGKLNLKVDYLLELTPDDIRELGKLMERYRELRAKRDMLLRNIEELKLEIDELTERLKEKERIEMKLRAIDERVEELKRIKGELEKKHAALNARMGELQGLLSTRRKLEEEAKKLEEELVKLRAELEWYKRVAADLERIRNALGKKALQQVIRKLAKQLIEAHMREILAAFNLDFIDVKLTDDYDIILVSQGGERSFRMLSGGERTAIALAFRMAFARMLTGRSRIHTLILDEPTLYLDEQRKRELIRILRSGWHGGGKILPQLIIVTHDREIEEAADQIIEVFKEGGESRVRIIEASG